MAITTGGRKPAITMTRSDHASLSRLAESCAARDPDTSEQLLAGLERARVLEDRRIAADIVRMGSTLRFTTDAGKDRTVTLVFPGEADIAMGKVSVLTPIGAALIGMSASQSIDWTSRDCRVHRLTVERVEQNDVALPVPSQPELRMA